MDKRIIVDSCCDLTPKLREQLGVISVPLSLNLGDEVLVDDDNLNINNLIAKMKACKAKIGSACPSPDSFKQAFLKCKQSFAVTISSNLSGSYFSALTAKGMAEEEGCEVVHVFDSKSASAGEILVVLKLRQLIDKGLEKIKIVEHIENFIKNIKTFFILENIDNLVKNGRLNKIVGKIISVMNIKPIMGSDGDGNIALFSHARGEKQIIPKLLDTIKNSKKDTTDQTLVITHCNNEKLAEEFKDAVIKNYNFKDIIILPTRGLSSLYANDKGLIFAF